MKNMVLLIFKHNFARHTLQHCVVAVSGDSAGYDANTPYIPQHVAVFVAQSVAVLDVSNRLLLRYAICRRHDVNCKNVAIMTLDADTRITPHYHTHTHVLTYQMMPINSDWQERTQGQGFAQKAYRFGVFLHAKCSRVCVRGAPRVVFFVLVVSWCI